MQRLALSEGRHLFGTDPAKYAAARPKYPAELFQLLIDRYGLRPSAAVFEVGAGTGLATRHLIDHGASPLHVIEPDPRLTSFLRQTITSGALRIDQSAFEDAFLPTQSFDLGVAATSFHWLDQHTALPKAYEALKPGRWWAMWWNCCDYGEPDDFQRATDHLFSEAPGSPTRGSQQHPPFPLDGEQRHQDLSAAGFVNIQREIWRQSFVFDTKWLVDLYSTFSSVQAQAPGRRKTLLDGIARIADSQFQGRVEREVITVFYAGQRVEN